MSKSLRARRSYILAMLGISLLIIAAEIDPCAQGGGGGGGGPGPHPPGPTPSPLEYKLHLGPFSYTLSSPSCVGTNDRVDPITLVATLDPNWSGSGGIDASAHLDHHGLVDSASNTQDFRESMESDGCYKGEISRATEGRDRWHARGHEQFGGEIHQHRAGWSLTAMTPHWDQDVSGCHAVPENYNGTGVSGFVAARNHIMNTWLASGHHEVVAIQSWGNTQSILQGCGTGWLPASNGVVYFLGLDVD